MSASTPGTQIRDLRTERKLSIESLAGDADLTPLALSNLELKSVHPKRETLIKILDSLDTTQAVPIGKRRALLEAFGYLDAPVLPNSDDIQRAVEAWQQPFQDIPYPAYLVDFAQRIHDWNDRALLLMGQPREKLVGVTVFDLMFSPQQRGTLRLLNEEELIQKTVRQLWNEYQPFADQAWCKECLEKARKRYPHFGTLYDRCAGSEITDIDVRTLEPVLFATPDGHTVTFKIIGTDLVSDPRFRAIQYIPVETETARVPTELPVQSIS